MPQWVRGRRVWKWAGLACSALLLAAWPIASWFAINWTAMSSRSCVVAAARIGYLRITRLVYDAPQTPIEAISWPGKVEVKAYVPLGYLKPLTAWRPSAGHWQDTYGMITELVVPAWWPAAIAIPLTAILWYRDRRSPSGCAKCGYDLTGNTTGICP